MRKVQIEKTNTLLDDFFSVEEAYLQFEQFDGQMSPTVRRLNMERGDSVAAIVFNADSEKLILTRQFRYASHLRGEGWLIEAVAGMLGSESPEVAIKREIAEEIGYTNASLTKIANFFVSPGGTSEQIHLFYAVVRDEDKTAEGGGVDSEQEDIQTLEYNFQEALELLENGVIADAKTIMGLLWLENWSLKN